MTTVPETGGRQLPFGLSGSRIELQEYVLVGVVILLFIAGTILEPDAFPTSDNILNVLRQSSVIGVLAIGMTFVIATAGIDLSVGSMVAAAAVVGGQFADSGSLAFILGAHRHGRAAGRRQRRADRLRQARAVHRHARDVRDGARPGPVDQRQDAGLDLRPRGRALVRHRRGHRHPVGRARLPGGGRRGWILLNRTSYGRHVVAVGGNREAARIAGIRVSRIIFSVYVISGFCVAIAAILVSGRLSSASPVIGTLYELDAIAAVVIGGTALSGGRATIVGTVLGVLTFALIFNLMTLMNLAVEIQQVSKGLIIVAAVLLQRKQP